MTEAEKMADEWWTNGEDAYDYALVSDERHKMLIELIQQVAERTLEECIGIIEETADKNKDAYTHYENHQEAIRSCRWWEEEA